MRKTWIGYVLLLLGGIFGIHKFYLGQWVWGLIYLFTGGIFLIGCLVDLFTLPSQVRLYNVENGHLPPHHTSGTRRNAAPPLQPALVQQRRREALVAADRRIQQFSHRLDHLEAAIHAKRY